MSLSSLPPPVTAAVTANTTESRRNSGTNNNTSINGTSIANNTMANNNNFNPNEMMQMFKGLLKAEMNALRSEFNLQKNSSTSISSTANSNNTDDGIVTFNTNNDTPAPIRSRPERVSIAAAAANKSVLGRSPSELRQLNQFLTSAPVTTANNRRSNTATASNNSNNNDDSDSENPADYTSLNSTVTNNNTGNYKVSTNTELSSSILLPELFQVSFETNMRDNTKPRQFKDLSQMQDMFRHQLFRFIQQDIDSDDRTLGFTSAWIKYEQFIIRLSIEKGFHAAQEYHWRFFEGIVRGEVDILRQPFDSSIMRELDQKYPTDKAKHISTAYYEVWNSNTKSSYSTGKSSSSASGKSKSSKPPRIPNACPKHPLGEHTWDECSTNPSSPHYGDPKWKSKSTSTDSKPSTAAAKKQ